MPRVHSGKVELITSNFVWSPSRICSFFRSHVTTVHVLPTHMTCHRPLTISNTTGDTSGALSGTPDFIHSVSGVRVSQSVCKFSLLCFMDQ
jgi:hypothetical protein